ncbi:hypothetical protein ACQ858_08405 [Variovorax ureilyticus]|uniref:hypothetical protein n=1 Tax=Variovorax ureilyticus TaxID=1836198 RepID=UPI003D671853
MTLLVQRAAQQYTPLVDAKTGNPLDNTPRTLSFTATIPAGKSVRGVKLTFTTSGWPAALCLLANIGKPDGTWTGWVMFDGGGTVSKVDGSETCSIWMTPDVGDPDLDTGQYTLALQVWQAITAAAAVEYF